MHLSNAMRPMPEGLPSRALSMSGHTRLAAVCYLLVAAMVAAVLFIALRSPMKDDLAWLLWVARQWLRGRELYVEVVEVNPPLIVWISALPMMISEAVGLTGKQVALPMFAAIIVGSAWIAARLLRDVSPVLRQEPVVFAVIAGVLVCLPGLEFGQREHLLVAVTLPYIAYAIRAVTGPRPAIWPVLLAAGIAGIACGLKPRYALGIVAVEFVVWVHHRYRPRLAPFVAAAVLGLYIASIFHFYPAFMDRAVPLALTLYGGTNTDLPQLALESWRLLAGVGVCMALTLRMERRTAPAVVMQVLTAYAIAATVVMFLDGKNWFYHRIPGTVAVMLALFFWLGHSLLEARQKGLGWDGRRMGLAALAALPLFLYAEKTSARLYERLVLAVEPELSTEVKLERLIRREKAKTYVAFSEWIGLGFPVVNNTGVTWASRFDSMWALRGELWRSAQDGRPPAEYPIHQWVARDFINGCPDLVVVDGREAINYPAVLERGDAAFARAWAQYSQIAAFDGLKVFRRQGEGCMGGQPEPAPRIATAPDGPHASPGR